MLFRKKENLIPTTGHGTNLLGHYGIMSDIGFKCKRFAAPF